MKCEDLLFLKKKSFSKQVIDHMKHNICQWEKSPLMRAFESSTIPILKTGKKEPDACFNYYDRIPPPMTVCQTCDCVSNAALLVSVRV